MNNFTPTVTISLSDYERLLEYGQLYLEAMKKTFDNVIMEAATEGKVLIPGEMDVTYQKENYTLKYAVHISLTKNK
jgi:hypothetical protein